MELHWFKPEEVEGLNERLALMLDQVRTLSMIPIRITRGKDTVEHNKCVNGVEDSAHLDGLAVDIACSLSFDRMRFVAAAFKVGFVRIGVYNLHIHLDIDETKPQNVMWVGVSH